MTRLFLSSAILLALFGRVAMAAPVGRPDVVLLDKLSESDDMTVVAGEGNPSFDTGYAGFSSQPNTTDDEYVVEDDDWTTCEVITTPVPQAFDGEPSLELDMNDTMSLTNEGEVQVEVQQLCRRAGGGGGRGGGGGGKSSSSSSSSSSSGSSSKGSSGTAAGAGAGTGAGAAAGSGRRSGRTNTSSV